jgi:hypothetical protein
MNPTIERLKLIFLAAFLALSAGALVWQAVWIQPRVRCDEAGKWWDPIGRVCAQPVLISDITGRTAAEKQADAAKPASASPPTAN